MSELTETTDGRAVRIAESIRTQIDESSSSRRSFLGWSAVAGGALLALGTGTGLALQDDDDEEEDDDVEDEELTEMFDSVQGTDVDVLNYALTLEHLSAAFYGEVLETFDEEDFVDADALEGYDEETRREFYGFVEEVDEHENAHVDTLTRAVELLGHEPAAEDEYDFDVDSVGDAIETGRTIENTAVAAYAGAGPFVESPDLLSTALSIHSVEARHAAIFNLLDDDSPFPDAFDEAMSQDDVFDALDPFIVTDDPDDEPDDDPDDEPDDDVDDEPDDDPTDPDDDPTDPDDEPDDEPDDDPTDPDDEPDDDVDDDPTDPGDDVDDGIGDDPDDEPADG